MFRLVVDTVFLQVRVELLRTQTAQDLEQLLVIVGPSEKVLFTENLGAYQSCQKLCSTRPRTIEANMQPTLHRSKL